MTVAGLTIRLEPRDPDLSIALAGPSLLFASDPADPPTSSLAVSWDRGRPLRSEPLTFDSGGVWRLRRTAEAIEIETYSEDDKEPYRVARLGSDLTRGEIFLNRAKYDASPVNPLEYPLDEILYLHLLARGAGIELHGCGIDDGGRGTLFLGSSGAGKSTTARLWQQRTNATILSDDRIIVRRRGDDLWMFGTPWHGEAELAAAAGVRLDRIFLLQQATHNAIAALSTPIAVTRMFTCAFPLFYDAAAVEFTLAFLEEIARYVPVAELQFVNDLSAVDLVR